ncbi:MAG: hypothetical protein ACE5E6_05530 [Phycisphaerae bacterium]
MDQVKLLGMTAVLTLLIWMTANSLVIESARIPITFELQPDLARPDMLVTLDATAGNYHIDVSGPRKDVEKAKDKAPLRVTLRIPDRPTGADAIEIKPVLEQQWDRFPSLSLVGVNPPTLPVVVDHMVTVSVPVEPKPLKLAYVVTPRLNPTHVTATLRESDLTALRQAETRLRIEIDVETHLRDLPAGKSVSIDVPLEPALHGRAASVDPVTVHVTATVKGHRKTAKIGPVPVRADVSFESLGRPYRPVMPDGSTLVMQTITVTGPVEDVERLERNETRAIGLIRLRAEDFDHAQVNTIRRVIPDFFLPPRIELAEPAEPVEFKLIPVTDAERRD